MSKPAQTGEYRVRLAELAGQQMEAMTAMRAHITADAVAFAALISEVKAINADVKALLETKALAFGAWKAVTVVGVVISVLATLYISYSSYLGHFTK